MKSFSLGQSPPLSHGVGAYVSAVLRISGSYQVVDEYRSSAQ